MDVIFSLGVAQKGILIGLLETEKIYFKRINIQAMDAHKLKKDQILAQKMLEG